MKNISFAKLHVTINKDVYKQLLFCNVVILILLFGVAQSFARESYISTKSGPEQFPLVSDDKSVQLCVSSQDYPGVLRVAAHLQEDIKKVTGVKPEIVSDSVRGNAVIIGTIGKSPVIDKLAKENKINAKEVSGRWDTYALETVKNPLPNVSHALVIYGSNKRGTIYGMYDLSQQIGVSPWYWWADVPVKKKEDVYVKSGFYFSGEPKVKYRGIFINDDWGMMPWAQEKFGGYNSKMYVHVYELILRMRGNFLWPGMLGKSIYQDDPESPRLADEFGIVIGTSHHEPMTRAHSDWHRGKKYGNGKWNYGQNEEGLKEFWYEGLERNKYYEVMVTLGMRGDGDTGMEGKVEENISLMEKMVVDQRSIISEQKGVPAEQVPQAWALYKEVQDYYDKGMKVAEDIILLYCDDNWGNIRRLPGPEMRNRPGGAGVYYHFDYHGSPRSYEWINTNPLPKIWEQMNMAYKYNANKIWVVNVGDIKPMEFPIEFFLSMAWDPDGLGKDDIAKYTHNWTTREFGEEYAADIADILSRYAKYNAWRKPELLVPGSFSLVNYSEAERVLNNWQEIAAKAEFVNDKLPQEYREAFYQLVLYPAKGCANVNELYIAADRNRLYAQQGRVSANDQANKVRNCFQLQQELDDAYHKLCGGKWNHMMGYPYIGYSSWNAPKSNTMPEVVEIELESVKSMGVSVEGSESAWPEYIEENTLVVELESLATQPGFSPLSVIRDSSASGEKAVLWPEDGSEQYLTSPTDEALGYVTISFTLSQATDVQFQLQVYAPNAHDDSLYYKLDSGRWNSQNNISTGNVYKRVIISTFNGLASGNHTLKILRREDGIKLDRVLLKAFAGEITGEINGGSNASADLPIFDSINQQKYWFDVFKRGSLSFTFEANADKSWVRLSKNSGSVEQDQRLWVSVDWDKAPMGVSKAKVVVSRPGGESVTIGVHAVRSEEFTKENVDAHGGLIGPVVFAAEKTVRNIPANGVKWEKIPEYGRGESGMAIFPVTASSVNPPKDSPCLEYKVFIAQSGTVTVDVMTGVAMKIQPDRGVRLAVSFDENEPIICDAFEGQSYKDPENRKDKSSPPFIGWYEWVKNNIRRVSSTHKIDTAGVHTLKIWMVDPGVVLEKVVIHRNDLKSSYFGPPEICSVSNESIKDRKNIY